MSRVGYLALALVAGVVAGLPSSAQDAAPGEPAAPASASVSFEVWQGLTRLPAVARSQPPRVELVVDLTRSMRQTQPDQPMPLYGAREAAALLIERLPGDTAIEVSVLGVTRRGACAGARSLASGSVARLRRRLAERLRELMPEGEGSLAEALAAIAASRSSASGETRVVAFSDLDTSCGGDLCAAAEALLASGAQLELVLFGGATAPACLAGLKGPVTSEVAARGPAPALRVESVGGGEPVRIEADGSPVEVPSGPAKLVIEGEPIVEIGPLPLEPGTRTRVQLLDFPMLDPPLREWRWKVER